MNMKEPSLQWHSRQKGFWGNMKVHRVASTIYAAAALYPLLYLATFESLPPWATSGIVFPWALGVVMGYPIWSWWETIYFEKWIRDTVEDEETRKRERAYYSLMRDHAKSFWAALLAVYSIAGLWILLPKNPLKSDDAPQIESPATPLQQ